MSFDSNIYYLEESDVTSSKKLKPYVTGGKPTIVMCQSSGCGHCQNAKPAFQALADKRPDLRCCTIALEDVNMDDIVKVWNPEFRGVPCFLIFSKDGSFSKVYSGDRSTKSFEDAMKN